MADQFSLPPLPYPKNALEPLMSEETLEFHYSKHHKAYIDKLNTLLESSPLRGENLEGIIKKSTGPLFNNAAQAWNHTFFWQCLSPRKVECDGLLKSQIETDFESFEKFKTKFEETAVAGFASGWTWLEKDNAGKLSIRWRPNAETPIQTKDSQPIFVLDLWEHAYYIDCRNDRKKFLQNFWQIANWEFAAKNFESSEAFQFKNAS